MKPNYTYYAKLVRVIDGDTIVAMIDLGHKTWVKRHIRLLDVYAPEVRTRDAEEKTRGLVVKSRLESFLQLRTEMFIQTVKKDSFGRYLGNIWVDGINVNDFINSYIKGMK